MTNPINEKASISKYTLDDGVAWAKKFEPILARLGWHVALGGSLIYRGWSANDIDLIVYPHDHRKPAVLNVETLARALQLNARECAPGECEYKRHVWELTNNTAKINLFVRP